MRRFIQSALLVLALCSCGTRDSENGFDGNNVVLSLAVVSDVHINTGVPVTYEKWTSALNQLVSKAAEDDADGLDVVLVAGDLIDYPSERFLGEFKRVYESVLDPVAVPLIYAVGNHDVPKYRWDSTMVSDASYIRDLLGDDYFLKDIDKVSGEGLECRHCQVGGYDVIAISPYGTGPVVYSPDALGWLDSTLSDITSKKPDRYVLLITHPMMYDTVYGSLLGEADGIWKSSHPGYWATREIPEILSNYPQVVAFGGHLHFPLNDPRSVWQGSFTALGCGSVRYMALEAGNYEYMAGQTVMKDKDEFSQGNLVQFDRRGNMRILRMDFYNGAVIGEPLVMRRPLKNGKHLRKYSFEARQEANGSPSLSTMDVLIIPATDSTGRGISVSFASGADDSFVHHYEVSLSADGRTLATKKILADFYKYPDTSMMKPSWDVTFGPEDLAEIPEKGRCSVTVKAFDSWDAASEPLVKEVDL